MKKLFYILLFYYFFYFIILLFFIIFKFLDGNFFVQMRQVAAAIKKLLIAAIKNEFCEHKRFFSKNVFKVFLSFV